MKRTIMLSILVWMLVTLLLGCSGGGGSSSSPDPSILSSNPSIPTPNPNVPNPDQSTPNSAPIANAGIGRTVHVGDTVPLDGTGSADPDGDSLSFQWTIVFLPEGSGASLLDADKPNPSFTVDREGDYLFQLVVTDTHGLSSPPATVTISTVNSAPVADAGPDQSVSTIGTSVSLGGQSFDPDGDPIVYSWSIKTKPSGSSASLSDPSSPNPSLVADVRGDYVVELVVTDSWGASSAPDTMEVSFENLKPVAKTGEGLTVILGSLANLNGSASYDPNGDPLTYRWSFVYRPENSTAGLNDPSAVNPSFLPDLAGTYVVSLIVNDGQVDSDPSTVSITVVSSSDPTISKLVAAINAMNSLDASVFKNRNLKRVLTAKLNVAVAYIDQGLYMEAKSVLQGILKKMDGCARKGAPDNNDWIITCDAQNQVYPLITSAIDDLAKK